MLVSISDLNITNYILSGYNVNETNYFKQKRDGLGRKHRDLIRKEISGTFELKISTPDAYSDFIEKLKSATLSDGRIPMSVYVNNINQVKTRYFFYSYNVKLDKDINTGKHFRKFTFSIEEA